MEYNRQKVVDYAKKWALGQNPLYYNCSGLGGDCANFASQCIYKGAGIMNYKSLFGWYYNSAKDKTPSWCNVEYFYNFLIKNKESGPYGQEVDISELKAGDIIQLALYLPKYHHTLVVLDVGKIPKEDNIVIAAHSYNSVNRFLNTYDHKQIRFIHIDGVRE